MTSSNEMSAGHVRNLSAFSPSSGRLTSGVIHDMTTSASVPRSDGYAVGTPVSGTTRSSARETLKTLIEQKEKELHDINEYRLAALEQAMEEKEQELDSVNQKYKKLKEDFQYNLKLIEERDSELRDYESVVRELREALEVKETEAKEAIRNNAKNEEKIELLQSTLETTQEQAHRQADDLKRNLENAQISHEHEVKSLHQRLNDLREEYEERLDSKDKAMYHQQKELRQIFDESLENERSRRAELAQNEATLQQKLRETKDKFDEYAHGTDKKINELQDICKEKDLSFDEERRILSDRQRSLENELQRTKDDLQDATHKNAQLLRDYEDKMHEMESQHMSFQQKLQQTREEHRNELQTLRDQNDKHICDLRDQLHQSSERSSELQSQLKMELQKTEVERQKLASELSHVRMVATQLENKNREAHEELERTHEEHRQYVRDSETNEHRLKAKERDLKLAQDELADIHRQLEEIEELWRERMNSKCRSLQEQLERETRILKKQRDDAINARHVLEDEKHKLQAELQVQSDRMIELKAALARVRAGAAAVEATYERVSGREDSTRSHKSSSPVAPVQYSSPATGFRPSASPMFSEDLGDASPLFKDRSITSWTAKPSSEQDRAQSSVLQARCKELQQQCDRFRAVISDMRIHMESLQKEHDEREQEKLSDKDEKIQALESRLATAQTHIRSLHSTIQSCASVLHRIEIGDDLHYELHHHVDVANDYLQHLDQVMRSVSPDQKASLESHRIAELQARLDSSHDRVQQLSAERDQLMEVSNELRSKLRSVSHMSGGTLSNGQTSQVESVSNARIEALQQELTSVALANKELREQLNDWIIHKSHSWREPHVKPSATRSTNGDTASTLRSKEPLQISKIPMKHHEDSTWSRVRSKVDQHMLGANSSRGNSQRAGQSQSRATKRSEMSGPHGVAVRNYNVPDHKYNP